MNKKDAYIGRYVYHSTDKAAFFKIEKLLDNGLCKIKQIDNLGRIGDKRNFVYTVKIKELKKDYI